MREQRHAAVVVKLLDKSPQTGHVARHLRRPTGIYVKQLLESGEKDARRLTVCGLVYLRELDGRNEPVKAGFTGC